MQRARAKTRCEAVRLAGARADTLTVYVPYVAEFPDREETRVLVVMRSRPTRKVTRLSLEELYCADPECDCQRVFIRVVDQEGKPRADIGYDFGRGPGGGAPAEDPYLEPMMAQPDGAEAVLDAVRDELRTDPAYRERLRRHYREIKERVQDPLHPSRPEVLEDRQVMKRWAKKAVRQPAAVRVMPKRDRKEKNRRKRLRRQK